MSARKLMLVVGEDGYGKRFATKELKAKGRGTMGVKVGEGPLAAAWMVRDSDELIVATRQGQMIRLSASDVPVYHRRARGVRVVRVREGDQVAAVALVKEVEKDWCALGCAISVI